jgi:diguanylate cyclase (GGDEF)-like protein
MRLIRLCAVVGSLILLVGTTVSMVNHRAQERAEQRALVAAVAVLADQSVLATVERAVAAVGVAGADTDPADLLSTFGAGSAACVASSAEARCTAGDLAATGAFGAAVRTSVAVGGPAVTVDEATASVLVVERDGDVTTSLRLPDTVLVGPTAVAAIAEQGATVELTLSQDSVGPSGSAAAGAPVDEGPAQRTGPTRADGRITVVDTIAMPGDEGSVRVSVTLPDDLGLVGEGGTRNLVMLVLGAVLLGLAGSTFLGDRRTLERRATTDDLTGLPNRREFERLTDEALLAAERFGTGLCVMLIDLNGFKAINDTRGHQFGDLVLRAAAARLTQSVREGDVVGRWGGDEFVVLLPSVAAGSGVRSSAERLAAGLAAGPIAEDVTVTAAIGAALFPRHGRTLDDLIRAADEAMYGAKSTGVTHRLADVHRYEPSPTGTGYDGLDRRGGVERVERDLV